MKLTIQVISDLTDDKILSPRIILLYATREEAARLLEWARERDLTGHDYVWIVTQSVIGESRGGVAPTKPQFPVGMLGELKCGLIFAAIKIM